MRRTAIGAVHHDRPLDRLVDADDRDFRRVDDRRRDDAAELAEARDGDGRARELLARRLVGARASETRRISAARSHSERASACRTTGTLRPSGVCVAMPTCTARWWTQHVALGVVARVALRELLETRTSAATRNGR